MLQAHTYRGAHGADPEADLLGWMPGLSQECGARGTVWLWADLGVHGYHRRSSAVSVHPPNLPPLRAALHLDKGRREERGKEGKGKEGREGGKGGENGRRREW